jgi:thiol-disulfide isomerase/thioredoxin
MYLRLLSLFVAFATAAGCSKPDAPSRDVVVDVGAPSATVGDDSSKAGPPATPPGAIEMPTGVDVSSIPSAETPSSPDGPKSGGIEMPKIDSDAAPVVSRRPVLDDPVAPTGTSVDAPQADAASINPAVTLTAATLETVLERVGKAGQICVVDVWSLGCEPCLKEFPGLVRLHEAHAGQVTCFSLNVDYDGRKTRPAVTYRPEVEAFLQSTKATFDNYLCETPGDDVYTALKIASIPAVLIYDANGTLVRKFTDTGKDRGFSYEKDIEPFVKSLVTK